MCKLFKLWLSLSFKTVCYEDCFPENAECILEYSKCVPLPYGRPQESSLIRSKLVCPDGTTCCLMMSSSHRCCLQAANRSDRDQYVIINWENIDSQMVYNFQKQSTNNLNTLYDYSSVMHYGSTAFSTNGRETITPIPNPNVQIGQRQGMSTTDILRIKKLYGCCEYDLLYNMEC
ncbi:hypothetical protein AALO_G00265410 [Alosa alosa]|uniref:Metalloendopeptidase n=1 Tax=Alosa alosa TaxID=278164 RepID=A0AAV6FLB0_9TELE|nr:hypothetical protein AALO_G00265410 [Alosa alosa]